MSKKTPYFVEDEGQGAVYHYKDSSVHVHAKPTPSTTASQPSAHARGGGDDEGTDNRFGGLRARQNIIPTAIEAHTCRHSGGDDGALRPQNLAAVAAESRQRRASSGRQVGRPPVAVASVQATPPPAPQLQQREPEARSRELLLADSTAAPQSVTPLPRPSSTAVAPSRQRQAQSPKPEEGLGVKRSAAAPRSISSTSNAKQRRLVNVGVAPNMAFAKRKYTFDAARDAAIGPPMGVFQPPPPRDAYGRIKASYLDGGVLGSKTSAQSIPSGGSQPSSSARPFNGASDAGRRKDEDGEATTFGPTVLYPVTTFDRRLNPWEMGSAYCPPSVAAKPREGRATADEAFGTGGNNKGSGGGGASAMNTRSSSFAAEAEGRRFRETFAGGIYGQKPPRYGSGGGGTDSMAGRRDSSFSSQSRGGKAAAGEAAAPIASNKALDRAYAAHLRRSNSSSSTSMTRGGRKEEGMRKAEAERQRTFAGGIFAQSAASDAASSANDANNLRVDDDGGGGATNGGRRNVYGVPPANSSQAAIRPAAAPSQQPANASSSSSSRTALTAAGLRPRQNNSSSGLRPSTSSSSTAAKPTMATCSSTVDDAYRRYQLRVAKEAKGSAGGRMAQRSAAEKDDEEAAERERFMHDYAGGIFTQQQQQPGGVSGGVGGGQKETSRPPRPKTVAIFSPSPRDGRNLNAASNRPSSGTGGPIVGNKNAQNGGPQNSFNSAQRTGTAVRAAPRSANAPPPPPFEEKDEAFMRNFAGGIYNYKGGPPSPTTFRSGQRESVLPPPKSDGKQKAAIVGVAAGGAALAAGGTAAAVAATRGSSSHHPQPATAVASPVPKEPLPRPHMSQGSGSVEPKNRSAPAPTTVLYADAPPKASRTIACGPDAPMPRTRDFGINTTTSAESNNVAPLAVLPLVLPMPVPLREADKGGDVVERGLPPAARDAASSPHQPPLMDTSPAAAPRARDILIAPIEAEPKRRSRSPSQRSHARSHARSRSRSRAPSSRFEAEVTIIDKERNTWGGLGFGRKSRKDTAVYVDNHQYNVDAEGHVKESKASKLAALIFGAGKHDTSIHTDHKIHRAPSSSGHHRRSSRSRGSSYANSRAPYDDGEEAGRERGVRGGGGGERGPRTFYYDGFDDGTGNRNASSGDPPSLLSGEADDGRPMPLGGTAEATTAAEAPKSPSRHRSRAHSSHHTSRHRSSGHHSHSKSRSRHHSSHHRSHSHSKSRSNVRAAGALGPDGLPIDDNDDVSSLDSVRSEALTKAEIKAIKAEERAIDAEDALFRHIQRVRATNDDRPHDKQDLYSYASAQRRRSAKSAAAIAATGGEGGGGDGAAAGGRRRANSQSFGQPAFSMEPLPTIFGSGDDVTYVAGSPGAPSPLTGDLSDPLSN